MASRLLRVGQNTRQILRVVLSRVAKIKAKTSSTTRPTPQHYQVRLHGIVRPALAPIAAFAIGTTATALSTPPMLTALLGWRSAFAYDENPKSKKSAMRKRGSAGGGLPKRRIQPLCFGNAA